MAEIKNIYCVGRNYVEHVHELGNIVPTDPVLFNKPTHSFIYANNNEIAIPGNYGNVHYEAELVLKMGQDYEEQLTVNEMIDQFTVGLDLTLRDLQTNLKNNKHPWLLSKGFKHAAIVGQFMPFTSLQDCAQKEFSLYINEELKQVGNIQHMIFPIGQLIHFIGKRLGLQKDDIIFTGTPKGVGSLKENDQLSLVWDKNEVGNCSIYFI